MGTQDEVAKRFDRICAQCGYTGVIPSGVHLDVWRSVRDEIEHARRFADAGRWTLCEVHVRAAMGMIHSRDAKYGRRAFETWNPTVIRERIGATFSKLATFRIRDDVDLNEVMIYWSRIDQAFARRDASAVDVALQEYERKAQLWQQKT